MQGQARQIHNRTHSLRCCETARRRCVLAGPRNIALDTSVRSSAVVPWIRKVRIQPLHQITLCRAQSDHEFQNALAQRDELLWRRQEELWDREIARWNDEREFWERRESMLLAEISRLQAALRTALTTKVEDPASAATGPSSLQSSGNIGLDAASSAAQQLINTALATAQSAGPPIPEWRGGNGDAALPTGNPRPETTYHPSGVFPPPFSPKFTPFAAPSPAGKASEDEFSSATSSVTAAMSAVDKIDVLNDNDLSRFLEAHATLLEQRGTSPVAADSDESTTSAGGEKAGEDGGPLEVVKAPPDGPPPVLAAGDNDIYWVAKLHLGLLTLGYYPDDGDVEDFFFGESTAEALKYFQSSAGIPETGFADAATWVALQAATGPGLTPAAVAADAQGGKSTKKEELEIGMTLLGQNGQVLEFESGSAEDTLLWKQTQMKLAEAEVEDGEGNASNGKGNGNSQESELQESVVQTNRGENYSSVNGASVKARWPVLMETDGGRAVHALQVLLRKAGYFCGDDEMKWWMFGDMTMNALRTFQACNGLPETGVCDERSWCKLLGDGADPAVIHAIKGDDEYEQDMTDAITDGRIYLLGEDRWSKE